MTTVAKERADTIDNLGSRFVKMEGLKRDIFELETPLTRFLTEAFEDGAHLKLPRVATKKGERGSTQSEWDRNLEIAILSIFGKKESNDPLAKAFTLDDVGAKFGITRERVRQKLSGYQKRKGVIEYLHLNSPDYLKHKYPLPDLLSQIQRGTKAEFIGYKTGRIRKVAEAIIQGANYEDLTEEFGHIGVVRNILSEYGLKVHYDSEWGKWRSLAKELESLKVDDPADRKEQILKRITRNFMDSHSAEYHQYFLTISDLCKEVGLLVPTRSGRSNLILQTLAEAGVMTRSVLIYKNHTHIILAVDKDQALEALRNLRLGS